MLKPIVCLILCCVSVVAIAADNPAVSGRVMKLYQTHCHSCHGSGQQNAPVTGKIDDWGARLEAGMESLLEVTKKGIKTMPPNGGCNECSDADLTAIIEMMITDSSGN